MLLWLVLTTWFPAGFASCPANAAPFTKPSDIGDAEVVRYANLFDIKYHETYKVIQYNPTLAKYQNSWQDPSMRGQKIRDIVLYQCGTTPPTSSFNDVSEDALFFSVPVERVALAYGGSLHFWELLSITESIQTIDMSYITSPCTQLLEVCTPGIHEKIASYGLLSEAWNNATREAEVIFSTGFGEGNTNSSRDVVWDVSLDSGLMARAEWIRFAATFFNLEKEAGRIFATIESDYMALKAEGSRIATGKAKRPQVAWVSWSGAGCPDGTPECAGMAAGTWVSTAAGWCPCGSSYQFRNSHYLRDVVQDTGGRLLTMPAQKATGCDFLTNTDGSQTYRCDAAVAKDHVLELLGNADVIMDSTTSPLGYLQAYTLDDFISSYQIPADMQLKAMTGARVFREDGAVNDAREGMMGSAQFEQMFAQPQEYVSDMMKALWGDEFNGRCPMRYLRSLYAPFPRDPMEHSDCPLFDEGNNHDCAGIHDFLHEVQMCAPQHSADEAEDHLPLALGLGLGIPLGLLLVAISVFLVYRCKNPSSTSASSTNNQVVVGKPVDPTAESGKV